jgi:hypothetical protein
MLLAGSMGLEEHRRWLSTVASEAEEAMAGEELAPGPEVLGASSSKVLRGEEKVGVWFLGSDDDGVVGKGGNGESRAERLLREEEGRHLPWTDSTTGDTWGGDCMRGAWSGCGGWSAAPVWGGGSGRAAIARTTPASGRQLSGHWVWQAGPSVVFLFIKIFKHPHFDIQIDDLLDVQNAPNFA